MVEQVCVRPLAIGAVFIGCTADLKCQLSSEILNGPHAGGNSLFALAFAPGPCLLIGSNENRIWQRYQGHLLSWHPLRAART